GADDQIALAPDRHHSVLRATVSVGRAEILDRHARHQKFAQHALVNDFHFARTYAFTVKLIRTVQLRAVESALRGIINHAEESWQDLLIELLGERLAFFHTALALALNAMSKHFVKKYCGGASGEQRRTVIRLNHRSGAEFLEIAAQLFDFGQDLGIQGKPFRRAGIEALAA